MQQAWRLGADTLASAAVTTTPELDARVLLGHLLDCTLTQLVSRYREPLPEDLLPPWKALLSRRAKGTPVAWLVGRQEFRGLEFAVGEGVLVPRADTETLVEAALEVVGLEVVAREEVAGRTGALRVVDVCTGSGCVAVALAHELPSELRAEVHAVDLSESALAWARRNAGLVASRPVTLHQGDLLAELPGPWHLIVSNPPYLTTLETHQRVGEGGWKEPALALDGGADGLDLVRRLKAQAEVGLADRGWLLVEVADAQVDALASPDPAWASVRVWKDLAGQRRVVGFQRRL